MSECVLRMEFRKNCLDCDLHQTVYGDSDADTDVYCFKEKRYVGKRFGPLKDLTSPSWCPIICSLPEGHGRLVDAHELFYNMFVMADGRVLPNYDCDNFHIDMHVKDIKQHILETPTIIPAERSEL